MALNNAEPKCAIGGRIVELETSNTDSSGAAVHESCYVAKIGAKKSSDAPEERKSPNAKRTRGQ